MQSRPYSKREERAMLRQIRLREQGYDSYRAYLQSPAWRDLKARYRASDLPQICMCGATKVQLHHTTYDRVGRELLEDMIPLCQECHTQAHVLEAEGIIELDLKGFYYDMKRARENAVIEAARKAVAGEEFTAFDPRQALIDLRRAKRSATKSPRIAMFRPSARPQPRPVMRRPER